jgi:glycosyltransferase involved in cell wall biosynthesis
MQEMLMSGADPQRALRRPGVSVVILTYNEEANLPRALDSVAGWADRIFVLDSLSSDRTVEIARSRGCHVSEHAFVDFGSQRNHALEELPIETEWVFFLDADEWLTPEFKDEISRLIASAPKENGFFVKRRLIWMGRWIKRGYYPTWILRLFRHGKARCESRGVNEHLVVEGGVGRLRSDFIHQDLKPIAHWTAKHSAYAAREAAEFFREAQSGAIEAKLLGSQAERTRWLRLHAWNRLPALVRPFLYFVYRLVLRGGFLDGREAFAYHFLHALWYPMLIDIYFLEMQSKRHTEAVHR